MYIIVTALSRGIFQYLVEKWARENPGLEISLWLERRTKKGKKMNCKPCIRLEGEISSMSVCNGYSGGRLASSTHCTCMLRMKALRSFKALVLKTPVEIGQEDVDMSVSPDDSKESK